MRFNGVIHMAHDGTTITLAEVPGIVYPSTDNEPDDAKDDEPDDGFETPQQRIRARLHKSVAGEDKTK